MEYGKLIKNSFNIVITNLVAYGSAALILAFGSVLVITGPPLLYGFVSMLVRGVNKEKVETTDVFDGFRSGNFLRGWIYALFMFVVIILILIATLVLSVVLGIGMFMFPLQIDPHLHEPLMLAIMTVIFIIAGSIILLPAIFILFVLPLFVIKKYEVTEALSESIRLVKDNLSTSIILSIIIGLIALAGVLPYYAGMFLQWPMTLNLSLYVAGIFLTMPLSQQILVNATIDLICEESQKNSFNS